MTKYLKSQKLPLKLGESQAVKEEFDDFLIDTQESGSLLRNLRESKAWSIDELAEIMGFDPEYIRLIESGEQPMSLDAAKEFGSLFDRDFHQFL